MKKQKERSEMKKFIVPAILLSAVMAGTSYGGGLLSDDDGTAAPSNRYPVAWANGQAENSAQYAGYPSYAGYGFAAPMFMSSWGKSPCGPDCGSVWAGYKTCHQGKGWGAGCGFGGCGQGRCGQGGCGFGHGGFGRCGASCNTCAPKAVGCNPCGGLKFNFNCKPKCKAKTCRPKCDNCCGQGFGGRPRCGCGSCSGFGSCGGCAGCGGECHKSMPNDAENGAEQIEDAPEDDVPVPPMEARLWRGLSSQN
jgi:hypothetical protein